MLVALHLFKVPDTDLLVHYGDGCTSGRPVLCRCLQHNVAKRGLCTSSSSLA
jgi:hypothetical protein